MGLQLGKPLGGQPLTTALFQQGHRTKENNQVPPELCQPRHPHTFRLLVQMEKPFHHKRKPLETTPRKTPGDFWSLAENLIFS